MNVAKLYDIVKDSYIQFNTAITARKAALMHSDEWMQYEDETVTERTAAATVNLNFLKDVFGAEGLKKLKEENMLTAFEGYTKQKDAELGENYWQPVIYISEDEFTGLMSHLRNVITEVRNNNGDSDNREPYVNAMKALVRTMIPDVTEAQMTKMGNQEIMKMVAGLNVSTDALRGYTLEEIGDKQVVDAQAFRGIISDFDQKFNTLESMCTSEYEFSIVRNNKRWFWIPVSNLP